ncbi:MAG: tetratricopeptide repeat protein [Candidatus Daviesbacteria bacterium]|nr:tetratricopeptide repeat protein [Candidatus Daviesbacteria bacterium]
MSIPHVNQIEKKLLKLARCGQYQVGMFTIDKYLKQYGATDEILLQQAFFLYHHAAALMYGETPDSRQKTLIKKNFIRAITICRKLIKQKRPQIGDRSLLNARIYLAQIYAMLRQDKKARKLAEETYKYRPSALSAERVADVYRRTGDLHSAIKWYKKAVKQGENYTEKLIAQLGLAVCYKQINKPKQATSEAYTALRFLKKANKDANAVLLGKSFYSYFPELRKRHR